MVRQNEEITMRKYKPMSYYIGGFICGAISVAVIWIMTFLYILN